MGKPYLDGKMVCATTLKLVYSDEVDMDEETNELICPCHKKPVAPNPRFKPKNKEDAEFMEKVRSKYNA